MNLAALSLEVWFSTYSGDGIRTENSQHALSVFTEEAFKKILADPKYKVLVCVEGIYLRGYALVNFDSQFENRDLGFEIERLYVQPPFQGQGVGRQLLSEVENRYGDKFWLYTWVQNKSIGFYRKYGFQEVGEYRFLFGDVVIENLVFAHG